MKTMKTILFATACILPVSLKAMDKNQKENIRERSEEIIRHYLDMQNKKVIAMGCSGIPYSKEEIEAIRELPTGDLFEQVVNEIIAAKKRQLDQ